MRRPLAPETTRAPAAHRQHTPGPQIMGNKSPGPDTLAVQGKRHIHLRRGGGGTPLLSDSWGGGLNWPPWNFGTHPPTHWTGESLAKWLKQNSSAQSGSTPVCHNVPQPMNNGGGLPSSATQPPPKTADVRFCQNQGEAPPPPPIPPPPTPGILSTGH